MKTTIAWLLRQYKRWISPALPPSCRFAPTCSEYAAEAVVRHGILQGSALAVWRLLRCHPFARGGWDPVPHKRSALSMSNVSGQQRAAGS
jgi:putative membrane protein insertion efficiency factor